MKRFIIASALALALAGCAQVQNAWNAVTGASVSPTAVIVAANVFDGAQATATNYLRLARCNGGNGPICRDPKATAQIIPAVRAGRAARNGLENFMQSHPGELGPSGLYDALIGATDTLKAVFAQYHIGGAQ